MDGIIKQLYVALDCIKPLLFNNKKARMIGRFDFTGQKAACIIK